MSLFKPRVEGNYFSQAIAENILNKLKSSLHKKFSFPLSISPLKLISQYI